MPTNPYFRWFVTDAETDRDFIRLSLEAKGLFLLCLDRSWLDDGLDPEPRPFILCSDFEFSRSWPEVERLFPIGEDGRRRNKRQEKERKFVNDKSSKNRRAADMRWDSERNANADANAYANASIPHHYARMAMDSGSVSGSKSKEIEQSEKYSAIFEEAWNAWKCYPTSRYETKQLVLQNFIGRNGDFWPQFAAGWRPYCDHLQNVGWRFCKLTLLGWVDAGMPAPPDEGQKRRDLTLEELAEREFGNAD